MNNLIISYQLQTTGLTGLAVSKNPVAVLNIVHNKILRCLQKMPEDAAYRKYTEQIINEREVALKSVCCLHFLKHWSSLISRIF